MWKGLVIALLLAFLIGGLEVDFGTLASGESGEVPMTFNCIFKPHVGKGSTELGFIEILSDQAAYKSRILGGAMEATFVGKTVSFSQVYVKGEPLEVAGVSTGDLIAMLADKATGTFDPAAGHLAIQVPMQLKLMLTGVPAETTFPAKFKGQREIDPKTGRAAIAGDIEMTGYLELPLFGPVSFVDIRVWCVQVELPSPVKNPIEKELKKPEPPPPCPEQPKPTPPSPPKVDVFFLVDLSASMSEEVPAFKEKIQEIVNKLTAIDLDIAFGLGAFTTFPGFAGFWPDEQNFPYKKLLDPGPGGNLVAIITNPAFNYILAGDQPESQLFALNQAASGPNAVKWRKDSHRLIVLLTDQPFTVPGMTRGQNVGLPSFPGPADPPPFPNTVKVLTDQQIEVIGIAGDPDQRERELLISDLKAIARGTGSVAPVGGVDCDGIPATVEVKQGEPLVCELDRLATNIVPAIVNSFKADIVQKCITWTPVADFTYSPFCHPVAGEKVTFDASASYDRKGELVGSEIVKYEWDFGDGVKAVGKIVEHVFSNPGSYKVTLTVSDSCGATNSWSKVIQVIAPYQPPPYPNELKPLDDEATPFDERDVVKGVEGPDIEEDELMIKFRFIVVKRCTVPLLAEATANPEGSITLRFKVLDEDGQVVPWNPEEVLIVTLEELGCVVDP